MVTDLKTVCIAGESDNDRKAIKYLLQAFGISPTYVRFDSVRDTMVLRRKREADRRKPDGFSTIVAAKVRENPAVVFVVHKDCDDVEPAHETVRSQLSDMLMTLGVRESIIAAPAWEIEAWWMLFPKARTAVHASWDYDYQTCDVGKFRNAKERLKQDLRKRLRGRQSVREYTVADSPSIASKLRDNPSELHTIRARSASFEAFRSDIETLKSKLRLSGDPAR
jgi:hypothetical protein